jgi:L-ascorbate metabolism protein UlaG (beta-lactamase superfamily)
MHVRPASSTISQMTLYHMGDTDIFGDMALIEELHKPNIGIVPIGDHLTMALACRRYFSFGKAIPCRYGSFPIIDQAADKFVEGLKGSATEAVVPKVGETISVLTFARGAISPP